jgi:hypothetical protein
MDRFITSLFHLELGMHNHPDTFVNTSFMINRESIKNFLICEKDIGNINKIMKYLNIKWDTPVDSVDNTPLHILTNAEYFNIYLLDQVQIDDSFFKCTNAYNLTPFISFIHNWKLFKNDVQLYAMYNRIMKRIMTHIPLAMLNPTSKILHHGVIQSLNVSFITLLKTHVNFKKWVQLYVNGKLPIDILYETIRKYGIDEDTFQLFMACEEILLMIV